MFFKKNRAPRQRMIPRFTERGIRCGPASLHDLKTFVEKADLGRSDFYLTVWMAMMDRERLRIFNEKCGGALTEHLKTKGVDELFLIELHGHKRREGKTFFYTFIGHDALHAGRSISRGNNASR